MNNKELLLKIKEANRNVIITKEIREAQAISFAKGNSFDVFTKENRLTRDFVLKTANGDKTF